jgi:proline iminopeptidase
MTVPAGESVPAGASVPYPPIEPYEHGMLAVGDGHELYFETCGNPVGTPAVVLHGGPGSGCTPGGRRMFDPERYRVVLFDQRGCGRSTPHAGDPATDLSTSTTAHLIEDVERLRTHLGIERWLVYGGSWGSVRGLGRVFPDAWARFVDMLPAELRDGDIAEGYARLLADPDPIVRERAAAAWCPWEEQVVPTSPRPNPRYADPRFRMAFARIVTHYWRYGSWLEEGAVLRDAAALAGIPGVLVQGSLDLGNLVGTPWQLARAWPGSELQMVDDTGHGGSIGMSEALVRATDRFADV